MNREILFKAKHIKTGKWIEGFYWCKDETTYCTKEDYERHPVKTQHYIIQERMTDWGLPNEFRLYEVDQDTLCQFTGKYDKNGNRIWESDILHGTFYGFPVPMQYTFEVYWDENRASFMAEYFEESECEVIGNSIDNPELLTSSMLKGE